MDFTLTVVHELQNAIKKYRVVESRPFVVGNIILILWRGIDVSSRICAQNIEISVRYK
jgi:hypothetical protein